MVDVCPGHIHIWGGGERVSVRLDAERVADPLKIKVVGDELAGLSVFIDNICLETMEICHKLSLKFGVFRRQASVDGSPYVRKIIPVINTVRPVIKTEFMVKVSDVGELPLQVIYKHSLRPGAKSVVVMRLIVNLVSDDIGAAGYVLHQHPDDVLGVFKVGRVSKIHVLPAPVEFLPVFRQGKDVRVFFCQPCRDGVSWRTDDDVKAKAVGSVKHPVKMGEVISSFRRFECTPGRFRNAYGVHAGILHHLKIQLNPFIREILVIVSCAEKNAVCFHEGSPFCGVFGCYFEDIIFARQIQDFF